MPVGDFGGAVREQADGVTWAELSDAATVAQIVCGGAVVVGGFVARSILRRIDAVGTNVSDVKESVAGVEKHLATLNGRLGRVEQRVDDHVQTDVATHRRVDEELRDLRRGRPLAAAAR